MTRKELSQLYYLNKEIEKNREELERLRQQIGANGPQLTGMPRSSGKAGSKVEKIVADIVDLEAIIASRQIACIHERQRLERYINTVEDSVTRTILSYRFVDCLSWNQIAMKIGGGNTADGVRKKCTRYLEKEK